MVVTRAGSAAEACEPKSRSRTRPPVDGVERNANGQRGGLDECPHSEAHAERQHELLELTQEERGHGRRDEVAATAEQGRAPEHDGRDRGQQIGRRPGRPSVAR